MLHPLLWACGPRVPAAPAIDAKPLPPHATNDVVVRGIVVATTKMSPHLAVAGAQKDEKRAPVWSFVLDHPTEGTVLIDTGFGRRTKNDPKDFPGGLSVKLLGLEMREPVVDLLPEVQGLSPVQHVILTHIHNDHAGGVDDFPDAKLWLPEEEWVFGAKKRLAKAVDPSSYPDRTPSHPAYDDGPLGPFERHEDLFGDGSVRLIPSPGHTPGSQLVLVDTPTKSWLFIGDCSWIDLGLDPVRPKGWLGRSIVEWDWRRNVDAQHRIHTLLGRDDLRVVAGHEPADMERLPVWPSAW